MTEDTDTILPLKPYALVDGVELTNWEILLVPIGESPIGSINYYKALEFIMQRDAEKKNGKVLVKGMSKEALQELYSVCVK